MKPNILYITPDFNLSCGVSRHIYILLTSELLNKKFNLHLITNGGDAIYKLNQKDIHHSIQKFRTNTNFHFGFINNLRWLKKYCQQNKIDIIHSHHRYPELLANALKKHLGIKTIITVHNFVEGMKFISYKSDSIIAINNSVRDHLIENFKINPHKIHVIYNCVDSEIKLDYSKKNIYGSLHINIDDIIILYLGRIIKEKGIDVLISAFERLLQSSEKLHLLIVGKGERLYEDIKHKVPRQLTILPSSDQIQKYYAIANMVVQPSYKEPFGYTMLEAGVNKIPFIGSRAGGIAEFIEDGVNGFLFEPGNSSDLANKINYVLNNPDIAKKSAERLNEKVLRLCNCKEYFNKLSEIYDNLLK